jgi:hypothetical protein
MTDSTSTRPLAVVLAELGWKPEVLARRLNSFAALHGRVERVHVKTPYKWLRGDRPRSPWPALAAALATEELGRPITPADLGWLDGGVECVSAIRGLVLPWTAVGSCVRSGWSPMLGAWTGGSCSRCWVPRRARPLMSG